VTLVPVIDDARRLTWEKFGLAGTISSPANGPCYWCASSVFCIVWLLAKLTAVGLARAWEED